jgi:hypothetical protein
MSCRVPLTWLICISLRFDRRAPKRRSGLDRNCANKHPHAHLQNSQLDTRIHEIIYIYIYILKRTGCCWWHIDWDTGQSDA